MTWMTLARFGAPVLAFAAWTAGAYFIGVEAGQDDAKAAQIRPLIEAVEADREAFTRDMEQQASAVKRAERRSADVHQAVQKLIEEAENDPARDPCPVTPAAHKRLRDAFRRIDEAAAAARAGSSE